MRSGISCRLVLQNEERSMSKLVLVGAGNMGFAMLSRWVVGRKHEFMVVEPDDALRARAAGLGIPAFSSPDELPGGLSIGILVIATKPQTVAGIVSRYAPILSKEALVVSVAAGVRLPSIEDRVGDKVAVVRAMPNTPASIGEGMIVCCPNLQARLPGHVEAATELLSSVGRVVFIEDESLMDAVTAVSGSGPAYVFHFIEALAAAGANAGLPHDVALLLARQTISGAAKLACESLDEPSTLREQVTSPNGTTAAALDVLMSADGGLGALLNAAVEAARRRSIELGTE